MKGGRRTLIGELYMTPKEQLTKNRVLDLEERIAMGYQLDPEDDALVYEQMLNEREEDD